MSHDEQLVGRYSRYLTRWFVLRQSVATVTAWAFLWGTAVIVLKVTAGTSAPTLLLGMLGLPVALGLAAWLALRAVPNRSAVRALLDSKGERGGLLMAGAECELGEWEEPTPKAEMPALQWRGRRPLAFLALAGAYVALAFLLPARGLAVNNTPLDIDRPADRLAEQIRVLKEEKIIDPERAETLKQKLEEVRAQAGAKDPAKTHEALDHLKDVVKQAARQAAEEKARQANQLGKVDAAAEALPKAAPMLGQQEADDLKKELAQLAEKAAAENPDLKGELSKELAEACKDGKLTPEQLKQLADAAKSSKEALSKSAKNLHDAKLIDADQLKKCEGGKCDAEGLAKYLAKNAGMKTLKEGLREQSQEGSGGVSDDGPGNTPLKFGDRSTDAGTKFKEEALPPADLAALKESHLTGVGKAAPKRDPNAAPPQAGGLNGAAAGGGSANAAPVLPQHRGPVGRYFDRSEK